MNTTGNDITIVSKIGSVAVKSLITLVSLLGAYQISTILNNSLFIGDKASHYDPFQPSMGDCKAFWNDVINFESLFFCSECYKPISMKNYDEINKKIRCKCGKLQYDWKK